MRELMLGSRINEVQLSNRRSPRFRVLIHNPRCTTFSQVATDTYTSPPLDITAFVEKIEYSENIGFENGDDYSSTSIVLTLRRHPSSGADIRRGLIEDGVIVQVFVGDVTVAADGWPCIFTGTFRGRPGDDPGTPAEKTEGLTATAHGREEQFLNLVVTTNSVPAGTDIGVLATDVARDPNKMGLTIDEVLFGAQGYELKALVNQIVEEPALTALWDCSFPVGKKPKFDALGKLRFVDVSFNKPAVRIYNERALIKKLIATPNEIEVNNSVVVNGLDSDMTKSKQDTQLIDTFEAITGFFDASFNESKWFSADHSQRVEDSYLVTRHKISWSSADWTQVDEFHGKVEIDCHTLYDARILIFITYLSTQIAVAALDYLMQTIPDAADVIVTSPAGVPVTVATLREILYAASVIALAGLLWSMQFIGRGSYEIWGSPYENVYQALMVRMKMIDLPKEQIRELTYRNDFVTTTDDLQALCYLHLQREMVKNQTYEITLLDDSLIEVDDIIEIEGDRYYVSGVRKTLQQRVEPLMTLTCWLIYRDVLKNAGTIGGDAVVTGYGLGYGSFYGDEL